MHVDEMMLCTSVSPLKMNCRGSSSVVKPRKASMVPSTLETLVSQAKLCLRLYDALFLSGFFFDGRIKDVCARATFTELLLD